MNVHTRLDEFLEVISDYQDTVAEGIMGIDNAHIQPNEIKGVESKALTALELVKEITTETIAFYKSIPDNPLYCGVKSECETFMFNLNKYNYLFSLCEGA